MQGHEVLDQLWSPGLHANMLNKPHFRVYLDIVCSVYIVSFMPLNLELSFEWRNDSRFTSIYLSCGDQSCHLMYQK